MLRDHTFYATWDLRWTSVRSDINRSVEQWLGSRIGAVLGRAVERVDAPTSAG
jgi:hypothetical protein